VRLVTPFVTYSTRDGERHVDFVQALPGWKHLALVIFVFSVSGCFRYIPDDPLTLAPGSGVRVLTTRAGAAQLAEVSEIFADVPVVDGTLIGVEGQDVLLTVSVGRRRDGFVNSRLNQTIRIPTEEIISFRRRELDPVATGLTVAGSLGILTAVVVFILDPRGRENTDPEEPPDDAWVEFPIFSFKIGR
jgi:hypothetical protein